MGSIDNRQKVQDFIHTPFKTEEQKRQQQLDVYRGMAYYGLWEMTNLLEKHIDSYGVTDLVKGYEEEIYAATVLRMRALDSQPGTIEGIKEASVVQSEKSYDDLEKMLMMRDRWLYNKLN